MLPSTLPLLFGSLVLPLSGGQFPVKRSWGEVCPETSRPCPLPGVGRGAWATLPGVLTARGAWGAALWQRLCSHPLGTVHLCVGQAGSQAVGTAGGRCEPTWRDRWLQIQP